MSKVLGLRHANACRTVCLICCSETRNSNFHDQHLYLLSGDSSLQRGGVRLYKAYFFKVHDYACDLWVEQWHKPIWHGAQHSSICPTIVLVSTTVTVFPIGKILIQQDLSKSRLKGTTCLSCHKLQSCNNIKPGESWYSCHLYTRK